MTGKQPRLWRKLTQTLCAAVLALTVVLPPQVATADTTAGSRTITLYHTHTQKTGTFTFRRNGQYDQQVLQQMNIFLADWRNKQPTKMDPALFDLMWQIYEDVGGRNPIHIVSSYRSPATNAKLRKASSGVAENSQHMRGKAIDFFVPGVNLSKLREAAMRYQVGGVGFYPTSGSPFVHVDTGSVRAWPRMTRTQLAKLFPDGRTLHLPTDGKPLSQQGRAYAEAQWTKCHSVPCGGPVKFDSNPGIMIASASGEVAPIPATRPAGLYDAGAAEIVRIASAEEPAQRSVTTVAVAPLPMERPKSATAPAKTAIADVASIADGQDLAAPVPATKSARLKLATRGPLGADSGETALAALAALQDPRAPALLRGKAQPDMVTAYVSTEPDPGAQLALKMLIERETTSGLAKIVKMPQQSGTTSASVGSDGSTNQIFEMTFGALASNEAPIEVADALADLVLSRQPNASIAQRDVDLTAPELDHVNETLVEPVLMTAGFWAVMSEAEGYLDKSTELGPLSGQLGIVPPTALVPVYDRFTPTAPLLVATR